MRQETWTHYRLWILFPAVNNSMKNCNVITAIFMTSYHGYRASDAHHDDRCHSQSPIPSITEECQLHKSSTEQTGCECVSLPEGGHGARPQRPPDAAPPTPLSPILAIGGKKKNSQPANISFRSECWREPGQHAHLLAAKPRCHTHPTTQ